jgi:phenylacetate-coenzyme A ligase PaaK-like adenylate-forming protein
MDYFKSFSSKLFHQREDDFEEAALELFDFQVKHNKVYNAFVRARKISVKQVKKLNQIPFLPIQFFKSAPVVSGDDSTFNKFYSSSGTTGIITSKHYFWSEAFYLEHAQKIFEQQYGSLQNFHVLALLPSYLEREGSSLVAMANHFIQRSESEYSGFYLYNHGELVEKLNDLICSSRKVLLIGVTFALLDLAEKSIPLIDNLMVMETGGMKGRRREMIREEVHDILSRSFGTNEIHSEYGMTELMSQAYSKGGGKFTLPSCMRIMIRDTHDPFQIGSTVQGGINVIDLANFHSCAFIETQDLGRYDGEGKLEILGRFDNSEVRGCNLMVN